MAETRTKLLPTGEWKTKRANGELDENTGLFKAFVPDEISFVEPEEKAPREEGNGPSLPRIRFVISTETRDRDGDVIRVSGWELENYRKNPVVLFGHDNSSLPIAHALDIKTVGKKLVAEAQFATSIPEFALPRVVVELLKLGTLRATSVGFIPFDAEPAEVQDARVQAMGPLNFTKQELVEFSIVPVPSNPDALMQARSLGIDIAPVVNWAGEILERSYTGAAKQGLWIPRKTLESVARLGKAKIVHAPDGGWSLEETREIVETTKPGDEYRSYALAEKTEEVEDPIRWNPSLSKAFDIANEDFDPSHKKLEVISKFLDEDVKALTITSRKIPSARLGSILAALDETLAATFDVEDLRNLENNSTEDPPIFESVQLNSTLRRSFLIEGSRFLKTKQGSVPVVLSVSPAWWGIRLTVHCRTKDAAEVEDFLEKTWTRSKEFKFLKGEAFALSGDFLRRGATSWGDVFLEEKNAAALKRLVDLVNEKGAEIDNRGVILMGPPGTGKTLGGRIMMNEAKATFIWVSARDFFRCGAFDTFTDAFDLAKENAPSLIFFEDVDEYISGGFVDLLKSEMDGIDQSKGVVTVVTSNHPERMPAALIDRPGRFHDVLRFDLPSVEARRAMLGKWLPTLDVKQIEQVLADTEGFSGAHMRELARFAEILKAESGEDGMTIEKAVETALAKIKEQRELINSVRGEKGYVPPPFVVASIVERSLGTKKGARPILDAVSLTEVRSVGDLSKSETWRFEVVEDEEAESRLVERVIQSLARRGWSPPSPSPTTVKGNDPADRPEAVKGDEKASPITRSELLDVVNKTVGPAVKAAIDRAIGRVSTD